MAIRKQAKQLYGFGPFSIDPAERLLLREGQPVSLTPKTFDLLMVLVENSGHLMEKDELMQRLWPGSFVEEANLPNNISLLRKALGDGTDERQYIETVPRRGYRFVARVVESSDKQTELIVEERTRTTLTLEQVSNAELQQATAFRSHIPAKRLSIWLIATLLTLACAVWLAYHLLHKSEAAPAVIRSIAVLPFRPLVTEAQDSSLEMGMADTLITRLSSIRQIIVRPTSAVRRYAESGQDAIAAGREQQVDAVLDGSIQKANGRIRVTVRLVSVRDGRQLWASKFDEKMTDIFAVQDSISERVAAALAVTLTGEERELLTKHHTENPEAYQFYLRGRLFYRQWTEESIQRALACFDRAIVIDPNYALAYAGKADVYSQNSSMFLRPADAMPKAKVAAQKALQIDDRLAEAHYSIGLVRLYADWDLPGAESEFKRALEIKPNDADLRANYGAILVKEKRFDEALFEMEQARTLDPLSVSVSNAAGKALYMAHRDDQAIALYREMIALYPNHFEMHRGLGCVLRQIGMYEDAIAELRKAVDLSRLDSCISELGYTYALAGKRDDAMKLVNELEDLAKRRYVSPISIARIYAGLGEKDLVFTWLRKGYEDHSDHILRLGVDPSFDGVRSDPRFTELLRRAGLGK